MRYGEFMSGLQRALVGLDRKSLAEIAIHDPEAFSKIVALARDHLPS
jgi:large subunit ribosomal protein L20